MGDPAASGEVLVNGLSVGEHYFACSVGDHCLRGMRLAVRVESGTQQASPQENQVRHAVINAVAVSYAWFEKSHDQAESCGIDCYHAWWLY